MHLASLAAMRTHAVTRHAAAAAICMPEGCRLLTQLLSPPLRQSIAVYACSLLELVVNDGALAGTVLREGKALGMLIQGVMTEASQASLRNTASSISAALEPASVAETGITELLESIRTLGEKEFVNDDAVGLVTALRLLQGFAAAQPDIGAAIVSSLGIHVLVGILNTVADALTLNEDDSFALPRYKQERTHIIIAKSALQILEAILSRVRASGSTQYKLRSLWDAMLKLASAFGTHATFLTSVPPSPASGVTLPLRDAWDSLVSLARHWTGTSWPSLFPRLLEFLLMAPRNFVGCMALLRDLLPIPSNMENDALGVWPSPSLPSHYNYDVELLSSQLQGVADTLVTVADIMCRTSYEPLHELIASVLARVCLRSLNVACAMLTPVVKLLREASSVLMLQRLLRLVRLVVGFAAGKLVLLSLDIVPVLMGLLEKQAGDTIIFETVLDITYWLCEASHGVVFNEDPVQQTVDNLPLPSHLTLVVRSVLCWLEHSPNPGVLRIVLSLAAHDYGVCYLTAEDPEQIDSSVVVNTQAVNAFRTLAQHLQQHEDDHERTLPLFVLLCRLLLSSGVSTGRQCLSHEMLLTLADSLSNSPRHKMLVQQLVEQRAGQEDLPLLHQEFPEQRPIHERFASELSNLPAPLPPALSDAAVLEEEVATDIDLDAVDMNTTGTSAAVATATATGAPAGVEGDSTGKRSAEDQEGQTSKRAKVMGMFTNISKQPFRARKQNTSRMPSMHVDDFIKKEQQTPILAAGAQKTPPQSVPPIPPLSVGPAPHVSPHKPLAPISTTESSSRSARRSASPRRYTTPPRDTGRPRERTAPPPPQHQKRRSPGRSPRRSPRRSPPSRGQGGYGPPQGRGSPSWDRRGPPPGWSSRERDDRRWPMPGPPPYRIDRRGQRGPPGRDDWDHRRRSPPPAARYPNHDVRQHPPPPPQQHSQHTQSHTQSRQPQQRQQPQQNNMQQMLELLANPGVLDMLKSVSQHQHQQQPPQP